MLSQVRKRQNIKQDMSGSCRRLELAFCSRQTSEISKPHSQRRSMAEGVMQLVGDTVVGVLDDGATKIVSADIT